jgi:CHASE3 domain sensor protein
MKPNLKTFSAMGHFLRWLPMAGSVTLMAMICLVTVASFSKLKSSGLWRDHSYEVLTTGQTLLSDLFNIQAQARDYVFTGQPADLAVFQDSVNTESLTDLKLLTRDNPGQEDRLRLLGADLDEMIAYSQQLVDTPRDAWHSGGYSIRSKRAANSFDGSHLG